MSSWSYYYSLANLSTSDTPIYEGELAKFSCILYHSKFLNIEWLLNGISLEDTSYKAVDTVYRKELRGVLVVTAHAQYNGLKIQCRVLQEEGYHYTTSAITLSVQGELHVAT